MDYHEWLNSCCSCHINPPCEWCINVCPECIGSGGEGECPECSGTGYANYEETPMTREHALEIMNRHNAQPLEALINSHFDMVERVEKDAKVIYRLTSVEDDCGCADVNRIIDELLEAL